MYLKISNEESLVNWMKLTRVKYLGPKKILTLFSIFKSMDNVISASKEDLINSRLFNERMIENWEKLKNASSDNFFNVINECKENKIGIITIFNEIYPQQLRNVSYPPLTLFLSGDTNLLKNEKKFAVAGSRESSPEGLKFAYDCSKKMADNQFVIVSGGAKGIDTSAHRGALDSSFDKTISVLGSGFFKMYPEENIPLFNEIKERGGLLISEYLPKFFGSRISYLQRNRIISGISKGLLICSSNKINGGSATQTKIAYSQKIPIFCPSLDINITPNEGIKNAIKNYNIKQITDAKEIIEFFKK